MTRASTAWGILQEKGIRHLLRESKGHLKTEIASRLPLHRFADAEYAIRDPYVDMRNLLPMPDPVVVDAGAATGDTTDRFLSEFPGATVHAVEPRPDAVKRFEDRFGDQDDVTVYPVALGLENGSTTFNITSSPAWSSVLEPDDDFVEDVAVSEREEVEVKRLDELVGEVDVLKLDLQGYELNALKGSTGVLDDASLVFSEVSFHRAYEDQALFCEIVELLRDFGFHLYMLYSLHYLLGENGESTGGDALFVDEDLLR